MTWGGRGGRLLLAALLLGACAESGDTGPDAEGLGAVANPRRPVQLMLRERADRLLAGDVDGYLAPMSPEARAFEEPIARSAAKLPLDRIDLTIGEATISLDGARFDEAAVILNYRYKDLAADNQFRIHLVYQLERRESAWIVSQARFDDDSPLPPPMWATGPVETTPSAHFLVMHRPGTPRVAEMVARAEQGLAQLLPKLTLEADPRYLMVLASDEQTFGQILGDDPTGVLAAALAELVETSAHPLRPEGRHMIVNLPLVFLAAEVPLEESGTKLTPTVVFQHELGHLALSRFTRPCTDRWVAEGAAMYLAAERRVEAWRRMVATGGLDPLALKDMGVKEEDDEEEPVVDYPYANAAVLYLVEAHGAEKFFDFYQNFKELQPGPACKGRSQRTERATGSDRLLRRYYGFGSAELDGFTRDYIRKAVAG